MPERYRRLSRPGGRPGRWPGVEALIDSFLRGSPAVSELSSRTRDSYARSARSFLSRQVAADPAWKLASCTEEAVREHLRCELERGIGARSAANELMALRHFFQWAIHDSLHPGPSPAAAIRAPRYRRPEQLDYSDDEVNRLMAAAWEQARDPTRLVVAYMMAVAMGAGLRLLELTGLRLEGLDLDHRRLRVLGKGRKLRSVVVAGELHPLLQSYLEEVRPRLPDSPFLFVNPCRRP